MATKMVFKNNGIPQENFDVLTGAVTRRIDEHFCDPELTIEWKIDASLRWDEYNIDALKDAVTITAGDVSGAFGGAGAYLKKCRYDGNGGFTPFEGKYHFLSKAELMGMYFCSHFGNYYHAAPLEEIEDVIEDLSLDGYNVLIAWYDMHHYKDINEQKSLEMIDRLKAMWKHARLAGMKIGTETLGNESFASSDPKIRASFKVQNGYKESPFGHYLVEICPNAEGGLDEIIRQRRIVFDKFKDVRFDYITIWPYDQGGCTCEKCKPWGANGFLKCASALQELYRELYPEAKILLSNWFFDRFIDGEWEAFRENTKGKDFGSVEYLYGFFNDEEPPQIPPEFIRKKEFPVGKGYISFPEVTMWGATPWGGFGANPTPNRWAVNYEKYGDIYCGMVVYSEGIFEDINKAMNFDLYSGRTSGVDETLFQYGAYEFCLDDEGANDFVKLSHLLEETWFRVPETKVGRYRWMDMPLGRNYEDLRFIIEKPERIGEAAELARSIDARMSEKARKNWRWRIFLLRALIDEELLKNDFHLAGRNEEYAQELVKIFHSENASYSVTPLTREAIERTKDSECE